MRRDAVLHRLIVIGHDRHHRIGARGFGEASKLDGVAGRVRACAGNDLGASMNDLDGGADEIFLLGQRERGGLTRRLGHDERGCARFELALTQPREGFGVDFPVLIERRREIGNAACQPGAVVMESHDRCHQLPGKVSSILRDSSTMVSGWWPFSNSAYLKAWARLTKSPPNSPFCSRATQLPLRSRPINTTVDTAGLHEGGSTSFT